MLQMLIHIVYVIKDISLLWKLKLPMNRLVGVTIDLNNLKTKVHNLDLDKLNAPVDLVSKAVSKSWIRK